MHIQILSDLHSDINDLKKTITASPDADIVLIAGDIAGSIQATKRCLRKYFKNSEVYFVNGNHMVYNNENKTINTLLKEYKSKFPIDLYNHHFLENQWCWLDKDHTVALIGCIFWTDYKYIANKMFYPMEDKQGRPIAKDGRILIEDPRETLKFHKEWEEIWFNTDEDFDTRNKKLKELYYSISPDNNETIESFKNRVSEEVYNNYINWFNDKDNQGYKEFTVKEYQNYNMRVAWNCMNDFRYGIMSFNPTTHLMPSDCLKFHKQSKKYIEKAYKEITFENPNAKIILMTHHPLSVQALEDIYKNQDTSAAFVSNLENWVDKFDNIKLVISGHIHCRKDFMTKGGKRYIINSYGYNYIKENLHKPEFNTNLIVEV